MSKFENEHQINTPDTLDYNASCPAAQDAYDTSFFPLSQTSFPLGTPSQSKISRKLYSDLQDERKFLLFIKELWKNKLVSIKEDKRLLEKMRDISKAELDGIEPLFCPEEKKPFIQSDLQVQEVTEQVQEKEREEQDQDDDEGSDEDELEDDEEARKALQEMLEEFGGGF